MSKIGVPDDKFWTPPWMSKIGPPLDLKFGPPRMSKIGVGPRIRDFGSQGLFFEIWVPTLFLVIWTSCSSHHPNIWNHHVGNDIRDCDPHFLVDVITVWICHVPDYQTPSFIVAWNVQTHDDMIGPRGSIFYVMRPRCCYNHVVMFATICF